MDKIIDKISSYNLFNYLLPGILFVVFAKSFLSLNFIQENVLLDIFLYYFIGLVISRFGSLVVEPLLKKISFLKFAKYENFVVASKLDPKIEIFSEANNMYRTFIAMFSLLLLLKLYFFVQNIYPSTQHWNFHILITLLLIMFLYSYRKQTMYIFNRTKQNKT